MRRPLFPVFAVILMFALSACVEGGAQPETAGGGWGQPAPRVSRDGNPYADKVVLPPFETADPAYPRAGFTYATASLFYGIQVEYFAPDGRSWLWFRGNARSLPGEWKLEAGGEDLCFRYGTDTRDAVTGARGGRWECGDAWRARQQVVGLIEGDPFGLSKGTVPEMTLRRCQLPPPMTQKTFSMDCI